MPTKVKFDPDKHKYYVSGREVPSVTTILQEVGILDDRWFKPGSDQIGTKVHEYLELLDKGFEVDVPVTIQGYVRAYQAFRKANPSLSVVSVEKILFDKRLNVCGKLDRIFQDEKTKEQYIIDIKTGASLRFHRLQLTGYAVSVKRKKVRIAGLYLSPDSRYKFKEYERLDGLWRSCVRVYDYKVRR